MALVWESTGDPLVWDWLINGLEIYQPSIPCGDLVISDKLEVLIFYKWYWYGIGLGNGLVLVNGNGMVLVRQMAWFWVGEPSPRTISLIFRSATIYEERLLLNLNN